MPKEKKFFKVLKHPLTWIIVFGFLIRVYGIVNFPVLHDEIMSILDGVEKTRESLVHFFFIGSLENTMGATPLYFWIERFFIDIFGKNNLGLRFFPLLVGTLTIYLAYFIVKKEFGQMIAIFVAFLVAFSDIFLWVTSKAQFFEVILVPLSFLVFYFLISHKESKYYWISLCFSLMLLTYFGKGLFLLFCFLLWYGITKLFDWIKLKKGCKEIVSEAKKELFQLSFFFLLPFLWVIGAHFFVFLKGPINNVVGLGEMDSIWKILYFTTFGYGIHTKQFLAGSPRGTFLVFDNIHIWPVTSLLFVLFLAGFGILMKQTIDNWRKGDSSFLKNSFLLVFSSFSLLVLLGRGIISARFHLFYFVPFTILSSLGMKKLYELTKEGKHRALVLFFLFVFVINGARVSSWFNWYYSVFDWNLFYKILGVSLLFVLPLFYLIFFTRFDKRKLAISLVGAILLILVSVNFLFGPLVWGKEAAWAPAFDNKLNYLEGDEKAVINFALKKGKPAICNKLPKEYKEECLSSFGK